MGSGSQCVVVMWVAETIRPGLLSVCQARAWRMEMETKPAMEPVARDVVGQK